MIAVVIAIGVIACMATGYALIEIVGAACSAYRRIMRWSSGARRRE